MRRHVRPSGTGRAGFTLVETIIALVILAAIITPLFNMLREGSLRATKSVFRLKAANLALERLEEFKFGGETSVGQASLIPPEIASLMRPVNTEFKRLKSLLAKEQELKGAKDPVEYLLVEEPGSIVNAADFKRTTKVAYFPEPSPEWFLLPPYFGKGDPPAPTPDEKKKAEAYVRLTKRIRLSVKVEWVEKTPGAEAPTPFDYTAWTIVTEKW